MRRHLVPFLMLAAGASHLFAAAPAAARRPNVVCFFIDTLRATNVHCLGYPRETTHWLDWLARRGVLFEHAVAQSSWSLPSYSSFFTSLPPPVLGSFSGNRRLDASFTTAAKIFSTFGYRTGGFVAGGHLSGIFGLGQGFGLYRDQPSFGSLLHTVPPALAWIGPASSATRPAGGSGAGAREDKPFFAFVQGYDCHGPFLAPLGLQEIYDPGYSGIVHDLDLISLPRISRVRHGVFYRTEEPPEPPASAPSGLLAKLRWALDTLRYLLWKRFPPHDPDKLVEEIPLAPADLNHIIAHYDAAVTYSDAWLGVFLENLRRLGRLEDTIVIVAADHGEELGEHGFFRHGVGLADCLIHVPLVIAGPGLAQGRRISDIVELTDVVPTLLELCGIPPFQAHQGHSLTRYLVSSPPPEDDPERMAFSSAGGLVSVRTRRWHLLLQAKRLELYDLQADPTEQTNVAARERAVTERLGSAARDWEEKYRSNRQNVSVEPSPELRDQLRERGYW